MKKNTVNFLLIAGAAAAAFFIFTSMRRRRGSSVEAGPTIKQTEAEFIQDTEMAPAQPEFVKGAQSVVEIFKGLKRAPEAKAAAQAKRATRKAARKEKRAAKKVGDISVLY
jgi:hypothetical protein